MNDDPRERYAQAKRIFQQALEEPHERRREWIAAHCGDDAALAAEVIALLDAFDRAETGRIQIPGFEPEFVDPATLGLERGWRVLRELARGGMGVVYLAERADGAYQQQVALKLMLPAAALDPEAVLRLKLERQILARLSHPNIARLLDGGTAANGVPYLVMEYVEGERIDRWCENAGATLAQRLRLFIAVCDAVAYAHRNLVVHRDLKPGNVLVTREGVPKLLDFGIAKLLADDDGALTREGGQLLTPRYASPEQIRGEPVTTVSDVYALGVVLYELLTGVSPYGEAASAPHRLPQAICDGQPSLPSASATTVREREASADTGRSEQLQRARALRGDLDAIVLKALRKEPGARYDSVEAFAADVRAHLAGEPVAALRGSRTYRLRKLARRHWAALVSVAGVLVLVAAFLLGLARQLQATADERDKAARVAAFMTELFRIADPGESRGNTITVREVLDRGARSLAADRTLTPPVHAAMLQTVGQVYRQLGLLEQAQPLLEQALAVAASAGPVEQAQARTVLAGLRIDRGDYAGADQLLGEAAALQREHRPATRALRAQISYAQGELALRQGQFERALPPLQEAERLRREVFGAPSREVAEALVAQGSVWRDRGEPARAEAIYRDALAMLDAAGSDPWNRVKVINNLAVVAGDQGDLNTAEALFGEVLAIMREVLGAEHPLVAAALGNVASISSRRGDYARAGELLAQALALRTKALGETHPLTATSLGNLAYNDFALGRWDEAEVAMRRALELHREGFGPAHPHSINDLRNMVALRYARGDLAEARTLAAEILQHGTPALGAEHPLVLQAKVRLAWLDCLDARCDPGAVRAAVAALRAKIGERHPDLGEALLQQADAALGAGEREPGCADAEAAETLLARFVPDVHWDRAFAAALRAECAREQSTHAAALSRLAERYGAAHPLLARLGARRSG